MTHNAPWWFVYVVIAPLVIGVAWHAWTHRNRTRK
jgi:hypothetical protein